MFRNATLTRATTSLRLPPVAFQPDHSGYIIASS